MPNFTDFEGDSSENTMRSAPMRSGVLSISRLQRRYVNINFEKSAHDMCVYLHERGIQTDIFDRYRVAERAIYPGFGAVGLNRDNNLRTALFYWNAAIDPSADIPASIADRQECFVRALYESQRGNNAKDAEDHASNSGRINYEDDKNPTDCTICKWGVTNKFAECFVAMHPDITLLLKIKDTIYDFVRGFIAEYLYSKGKTYEDLKSPLLALEDENLLPQEVKDNIKAKIIEIFGKAGDAYEGFLTLSELSYLDKVLGEYLESVTYTGHDSPLAINTLISEANSNLSEARFMRTGRRAIIGAPPVAAQHEFDYDLISGIIVSLLPKPKNKARVHGSLQFEVLSFTPNTDEIQRNYESLFTFDFSTFLNNALYSVPPVLYSETQLNAAMQPQATQTTTEQARTVREQRRIAMGMRPNY